MALLIVDKNKCTRDGICVGECPGMLIQLPDGGFPEIRPGMDDGCVECGHCIAVCPHGALSHKKVRIENSPEILEELKISMRQAEQFLRSRRSIRVYQPKPVDKNTIRRLIEVARHAPTAGNGQLVEWLVLTDIAKIKKIAGLTVEWVRRMIQDPKIAAASPYLPMMVAAWDAGFDTVLRNAPAVVVASAPKEAINGFGDVILALSYLDLMAPAMGLGTCWAGLLYGAMLNLPEIKDAVGVPADHPHHYPVMLGYPEARYYRVPERKSPKIVFA
jgi:nitroreductase/NAD-dependent dihydropyrimidine dehydrogenase PreA subunit